jgi:hypothetical protein
MNGKIKTTCVKLSGIALYYSAKAHFSSSIDLSKEEKLTPKTAHFSPITIGKAESEIAILLDELAPGILDTKTSVLQESIPEEVFTKLSRSDVKFSDKISLVKAYLKQPNKSRMVAKMPTLESGAVRYSPEHFKALELVYMLRCVVAVFPNTLALVQDVLVELFKEGREVDYSLMREATDLFTKLRGLDAAISALASAASKVFYTVDALAFDDFAVSLTAAEWEIIMQSMDNIRLEFAKKVQEKSTREYHFTTSKKQKLKDKSELDSEIQSARHPLDQIQRLSIDDLHQSTQMAIVTSLKLTDTSKKIKYDRKSMLAKVKAKILDAYRIDPTLDIKKYALETNISF